MAEENKNKQVIYEHPAGVLDIRAALEAYGFGERRDLTVCFPACVREYDRENHKVQVVPLVKQGVFSGKWEYIDRKPYWVSVRGIQQGGFAIDIPLYVGDTGWVIASDRDTRLLKEEESLTTTVLAKDRPVEMVDKGYRKRPWQPKLHDLESGFFLPDSWGRFDLGRFKDSPTVGIGDGLYIGHSIDTKDEEGFSGDNESEYAESLQEGEDYEKKPTSSIVIEKDGGVHLLSSGSQDSHASSRISVWSDMVEQDVLLDKEDNVPYQEAYTQIGIKNGILVRHTNGNEVSSISHNNGETTIIATDNVSYVAIIIKGNTVTIDSKSGIDVNSCGDISITSETKARVVSAYGMSIKAKGDVDVSSASNLSIYSPESIDIFSSKEVKISAVGKMDIMAQYLSSSSGGKYSMISGGKTKYDYAEDKVNFYYSICSGDCGKINISGLDKLESVYGGTIGFGSGFELGGDGAYLSGKNTDIEGGATVNCNYVDIYGHGVLYIQETYGSKEQPAKYSLAIGRGFLTKEEWEKIEDSYR